MSRATPPLVSIVTPVYNGERYLAGCIESVLTQTYPHWEYVIVNNASTDGTLSLAERYARRESRIRIVSNPTTVEMLRNHNIAFGLISRESVYTKILHSDDELLPECVGSMVDVAESAPSVGLVGAYTLKGGRVVSGGLPYPETVFSGREICRRTLLREIYLFPSPSALLIRSDLIRANPFFYDEAHLHADTQACFEVLKDHDFGFVHQILTFVRVHDESMTSKVVLQRDRHTIAWLHLVHRYGPIFLDEREYKRAVHDRWYAYYKFLCKAILQGTAWRRAFWTYHLTELAEFGRGFPLGGVLRTAGAEAIRPFVEPVRRLRRLGS